MMSESETLILLRPGSESLWSHRRHIFLLIQLKSRDIFPESIDSLCINHHEILQFCEMVETNTSPVTDSQQFDGTFTTFGHYFITEISFSLQNMLSSNVWDDRKQQSCAAVYLLFILDQRLKDHVFASCKESLVLLMKCVYEKAKAAGLTIQVIEDELKYNNL